MIIETEGLTRRFLRHVALRDVNLSVPEGSAVALIGANGAGKTTLMRILVNILRPGSGSARVMGKDSRELAAGDFRRIGYVAENQKLPDGLTVSQFFAWRRSLYPDWDSGLEADLRVELELPDDRRLGKLSHGMRMKAMLAAVLPARPALLILDEPLSGLDPLVRDEFVEGLLGQAEETTILISSHEMTEIDGLATRVAYMDGGRLAFECSTEELLARFRQVSATFASRPAHVEGLPQSWISPRLFERTVAFVASDFSAEPDLRRKLEDRFGRLDRLEAQPMSLRDVSKALMKATRQATGR